MKLLESGENYLETILMLSQRNGNVRSIDVATELGYSKPSVSRAVGILKESGYIVVDNLGHIKLTEQGRERAGEIYDRHIAITRFLTEKLGLSHEIAEADACRIEHIISEETFLAIKTALAQNSPDTD
ncbi:MAG TPA: metal-dependent transcriptional regulator [Candidatus Acidoferrum sp.]|nr:metal-dependent transcriptional regulator [Candidatus Acidoferrum sp.]